MGYKNLTNKIDELRSLVGDWGGEKPSQLEMDMALDRVKKIYEILRFSPFEEEEDQKEELVTEVVEESIAAPVAETKVEVEPQEEKVAAEEEEEELLLDIDILKSADSDKYNKILSLYCDIDSQEPIVKTTTTTIETTTIVEQKHEESNEIKELYKISSQLGINDRFLLANDLFGGDMSALNQALSSMDQISNLDDVMIHIAENYKWNGDSDGAKLLFTLLQNRFL